MDGLSRGKFLLNNHLNILFALLIVFFLGFVIEVEGSGQCGTGSFTWTTCNDQVRSYIGKNDGCDSVPDSCKAGVGSKCDCGSE